ncbi:hypothetical protein GDO81_014510 [Engystomops pustulosus]|uniref:Transmembrane protein 100 n=1 Tax=Engystomops pustulosus TaxID=76066 RepID=A0AAV7BB29_ENGPU|nr:hypothetical protein GDO81_014510 [Engystomops pustulosus]
MVSSLASQEISMELDENQVQFHSHSNEQPEKSPEDPHLISTTTGGMENSCHSCLLGFGMVTLIIGISTTALYYASDTHAIVLSVIGHSILGLGIISIIFSIMWRYYRKKRKERMNEDLAELFYENQQKKYRI